MSQILEPRESRKIVSLLLTAPCAIIFTANPPLLGPSRTAGFKGLFGFDIKVSNFILKMILSYNKFLLKYCKIVFDVILILVKVISLLCWAILWFIDYKINAYKMLHLNTVRKDTAMSHKHGGFFSRIWQADILFIFYRLPLTGAGSSRGWARG